MSSASFRFSYISDVSAITILYPPSNGGGSKDTVVEEPYVYENVGNTREVVNVDHWVDSSFDVALNVPKYVLDKSDSLANFFKVISDILGSVQSIAEAIVKVLNALESFQESMLAILKKMADIILAEIRKLVISIKAAGVYMCKIPIEVTGSHLKTDGGFETYRKRLRLSLDPNSPLNKGSKNFPRFSPDASVGGMVLMSGAGYAVENLEDIKKKSMKAWNALSRLFGMDPPEVDLSLEPMAMFSVKPEISLGNEISWWGALSVVSLGTYVDASMNVRGSRIEWKRPASHPSDAYYEVSRVIGDKDEVAHSFFTGKYQPGFSIARSEVFDNLEENVKENKVSVVYRMVSYAEADARAVAFTLSAKGGSADVFMSKDLESFAKELPGNRMRISLYYEEGNGLWFKTIGPDGRVPDGAEGEKFDSDFNSIIIHSLLGSSVVNLSTKGKELTWCRQEYADPALAFTASELDAASKEADVPWYSKSSSETDVPVVVSADGSITPIERYAEPWDRLSVSNLFGNTLMSAFNLIRSTVNNVLRFANGIDKFSKYDLVLDQMSAAKKDIDDLLKTYYELVEMLKIDVSGTVAVLYLDPKKGGIAEFSNRVESAAMSDGLRAVINSDGCRKCAVFGGVILLYGIDPVGGKMPSLDSLGSSLKDSVASDFGKSADSLLGSISSVGDSISNTYDTVHKATDAAIRTYSRTVESVAKVLDYTSMDVSSLEDHARAARDSTDDVDAYFGRVSRESLANLNRWSSVASGFVQGAGGVVDISKGDRFFSAENWGKWRRMARDLSKDELSSGSSAILGTGSSAPGSTNNIVVSDSTKDVPSKAYAGKATLSNPAGILGSNAQGSDTDTGSYGSATYTGKNSGVESLFSLIASFFVDGGK